jgi:hypothetical protein
VFGGQTKDMNESAGYAGQALLLAVILIYLILASQFGSFLQPIAIMMSLPMSLIGVFLGLLVAGHHAEHLQRHRLHHADGTGDQERHPAGRLLQSGARRGAGVEEALLEAGSIRLRPILMTTLAMIFGMMPLALGLGEGASQRAPMAHAVIGGLISSTLLTLVVVPVVLVYIDRIAGWARKRFSRSATRRRSPQARRVNSAARPIPGTIRAMLWPCPMTVRPSACVSSNRFRRSTAAQWDACALAPGSAGNPFLSHGFLKALEDSKSVGRRTGWQPQYLLAETDDGVLQGAVPLYVKGHSQGEYIFDHGWAQAFERAGGRYYPKLQAAVPFTPCPGPACSRGPGPTPTACAMR